MSTISVLNPWLQQELEECPKVTQYEFKLDNIRETVKNLIEAARRAKKLENTKKELL